MKLTNIQTKQDLQNRLRRIEGQLRGVQGMIEAERECTEILQQLNAIRSAIHSTNQAFLYEYASNCLLNIEEQDPSLREKLVQDMVGLLGKGY